MSEELKQSDSKQNFMKCYTSLKIQSNLPPMLSAEVEGFSFPLETSDDIERLESVIRTDANIREQFVKYLKMRKPPHMDIVECFGRFFTDDAMALYAWNGCKNSRFPRRTMKSMEIFTSCMLDGWKHHGITSVEQLCTVLTRVVAKISGRRRSNNYNKRKRVRQNEEK